ADSLHSSNPDIQLEFIAENYATLFEAIDETGALLQEVLDKERPTVSSAPTESPATKSTARESTPTEGGDEIPPLSRSHLRHISLFLDAVDRNLSALKDRALRDVFENHVGAQIRAYLDDLDRR
ncbi:MAG: hypothetical protein KDK25_05260, partial [Leptospiraceae bacterium]|nr:hypothetical protein [Leptospiraceae bacterium]